MITVRYAVIHELIKKAGTTTSEFKDAQNLLPVEDEVVVKLINELDKLYGTKENTAVYGTFSKEDSTNQFAEYTDSFIDDKDELKFLEFSLQGLKELARESRTQQSATGGYIVFSYCFNSSMKEFLLVAMIKNKDAIRVNESLKLEGVLQIDLSKIHQAVRINIERLQNAQQLTSDPSPEDNIEILNYLSFISPRSNQEVSGYFIRGMDCLDGVSSAHATDNIFKAVKAYCDTKSELRSLKTKIRDSLTDYLQICLDGEKSASLAVLEHSIRQAVSPDNHELLNDFIEFVANEDFQIPSEFNVNASSLKKHTRIRSKNDNWELNFNRRALGTTDNSDLYYDSNSGKLIIRCSSDLTQQIVDELNSRNVPQS